MGCGPEPDTCFVNRINGPSNGTRSSGLGLGKRKLYQVVPDETAHKLFHQIRRDRRIGFDDLYLFILQEYFVPVQLPQSAEKARQARASPHGVKASQPRGLEYLHGSRTEFRPLHRHRERQEGGQRPDLRQSHAGGRGALYAGFGGELDAQGLHLADDVWASLLRDRDDVDGRLALRYCALWSGSISPVAAAERSHDHCWARVEQDGACDPAIVGADARAEVGDFDGSRRPPAASSRTTRWCRA